MSILAAAHCGGGVRRFTYIYETTTSPPGGFDLETWVTWRAHNDPRFDEVDFRHELEFGITERLQLALYFADWDYHDGTDSNSGGFFYSDSALELIYNLTNPVIDPVGLSIYQEYKIGDRFFEWESKLIAQKNFGPLILVYNATLEAAWEGKDFAEREGEVTQAFGASYEISPSLSAGLELLHEIVFHDWRAADRATDFFIGPNVSLRRGSAFVTVTALAQATDTTGEPDFQLRSIFGLGF
ncbi:MAG: hypothetical protein ABR514_07735 [Chthoniobacterales bacterium]